MECQCGPEVNWCEDFGVRTSFVLGFHGEGRWGRVVAVDGKRFVGLLAVFVCRMEVWGMWVACVCVGQSTEM